VGGGGGDDPEKKGTLAGWSMTQSVRREVTPMGPGGGLQHCPTVRHRHEGGKNSGTKRGSTKFGRHSPGGLKNVLNSAVREGGEKGGGFSGLYELAEEGGPMQKSPRNW